MQLIRYCAPSIAVNQIRSSCTSSDQNSAQAPDNPARQRSQSDRRMHIAIHDLANWTHAVTITFLRKNKFDRPCNEEVMLAAVRHFTRVLSIKCLRRKRFDRGDRIPVAIAFGMGSYGFHPHCHMAISAPNDIDFEGFRKIINSVIRKTHWFDQQFLVKPYEDQGWIKYMLDHQEELFLDLPPPAHSKAG